MKALKISVIVIASLLLISCGGYLYASSGVKSNPGYAQLIVPKGESMNAVLSIKLGPGGVGPARWLAQKIIEDSDREHDMSERVLQSVLNELNGVQLRVYEVGSNRQAFDTAIAESVAALQEKSWQTLATIRDDNEKVVVMHSGDDERISGISIMVSTQDNAVFLNLIGPFNPQTIAAAVHHAN